MGPGYRVPRARPHGNAFRLGVRASALSLPYRGVRHVFGNAGSAGAACRTPGSSIQPPGFGGLRMGQATDDGSLLPEVTNLEGIHGRAGSEDCPARYGCVLRKIVVADS